MLYSMHGRVLPQEIKSNITPIELHDESVFVSICPPRAATGNCGAFQKPQKEKHPVDRFHGQAADGAKILPNKPFLME